MSKKIIKALCLAAQKDDIQKFQELINKPRHLDLINDDIQNGFCALHYAACTESKELKVLDYLLGLPQIDLLVKAGKEGENAADFAEKKGKLIAAEKIRQAINENNFMNSKIA